MNQRMPVLFIGHGSPINAIADNAYSRAWAALGKSLARPKAILCVSAHWEAESTYVTASDFPATIHEFSGYPRQLHELRYGAPGNIELAGRVAQLLEPQRVPFDFRRGIDHGAWTVLAPMYPEAEVPVVELSLATAEPGEWHYALAKRLQPLRDEGVLIMGSGNIVHNLSAMRSAWNAPAEWARRFNDEVKTLLLRRDHSSLCGWRHLGLDAELSVPTPEHYLPLLYAAAQQRDGDNLRFVTDEVIGSISMTSVVIGD